jgi:hypothetical protein
MAGDRVILLDKIALQAKILEPVSMKGLHEPATGVTCDPRQKFVTTWQRSSLHRNHCAHKLHAAADCGCTFRQNSCTLWRITSRTAVMRFIRIPNSPWSITALPQFFEHNLIPQSVHGMPESSMRIGGELPRSSRAFHRFLLPYSCITVDVVNHSRGEDKEPAIDPTTVTLRFLMNADDLLALKA